MTSIPTGAAWRPYLRTLGGAGLELASVAAWIAAAELPPARRRLARGTLAAATVAVAIPGTRAAFSAAKSAEPSTPGAGSGLPYVDAGIRLPADDMGGGVSLRRRAAVFAVVGAVVLTAAVASTAATRQLERRWLARLVRNGHPHPHRALGVRMAALYSVVVVPGRLVAVRKAAGAR